MQQVTVTEDIAKKVVDMQKKSYIYDIFSYFKYIPGLIMFTILMGLFIFVGYIIIQTQDEYIVSGYVMSGVAILFLVLFIGALVAPLFKQAKLRNIEYIMQNISIYSATCTRVLTESHLDVHMDSDGDKHETVTYTQNVIIDNADHEQIVQDANLGTDVKVVPNSYAVFAPQTEIPYKQAERIENKSCYVLLLKVNDKLKGAWVAPNTLDWNYIKKEDA